MFFSQVSTVPSNTLWKTITQVAGGSLLLALSAQWSVSLPFTPVPITLQTLGVSMLALLLGPRLALFAVMTYLAEASMGLPVLAGGVSNPLWIVFPSAGYLLAFPVAAFFAGWFLPSAHSFLSRFALFLTSECIILSLGTLYLGFWVGFDKTIALGLLPFLPGALLKASIAASLSRVYPQNR